MILSEIDGAVLTLRGRDDALGAPAARDDDAPAVARPPATPPGRGKALSLRGVRKSFGERRVLDGIDLKIEPGAFIAIVGRSGCGKSTLLRLLAGLNDADGGTLEADDAPLARGDADTRIMFQEARLLPWKRVLDNVALGLTTRDGAGRAREALAQVGLADRAGEWPAVLSGGQRQRVALARALVHAPRLLLLDEPLGALDALTRIEMQQLIESLWRERGFTAVLVTHDVSEAIALADRVVLIEEGRIALDTPVDLPRPRSRGQVAFAGLEDRVLQRVLGRPGAEPDAEPPPVSIDAWRWAI